MPDLTFPEDFFWGVATAAHQIEGDNIHSDWWAYEQAGHVPEKSGRACDSWNRWREDLDLAAELGLGIFRISVEWARVEPEAGHFDEAALEHYLEVVKGIRERGMQCMVVLWHFTNPVWLGHGAGTWHENYAPAAFERFARRVAQVLGPYVDWWGTLNEVNTYASHGWLEGDWPPGMKHHWLAAVRVSEYLARGHRRAYDAIKEVLGAEAKVGITHVLPWAHSARFTGPFSWPMRRYTMWLSEHHFLDKVRNHLDWLGVQYYFDFPCGIWGFHDKDENPPRNDLDWRIMPRGLYEVLKETSERYRVPIIVTENGIADATDSQRARFLVDHLAWMKRAMDEGVDVRGYMHWSLLDNFEWAFGYGPRFGLAEVDYQTFKRTLRPSAYLFGEIARGNRVTEDMAAGLTYSDGTPSMAPR